MLQGCSLQRKFVFDGQDEGAYLIGDRTNDICIIQTQRSSFEEIRHHHSRPLVDRIHDHRHEKKM